MPGRSRLVQGIAVALSVLFGFVLVTGAAGAAKPDLVVTAVSSKASASVGGKLAVTVTVRNRGGRRAPASLTGFSLSRDRVAGRDIALSGGARAGDLKPGRSARSSSDIRVPRAVTAGSYFLVACSDAGRKVREASEKNNCKASKSALRVIPAGPGKLTFVPSVWNFGSLDIEAEAPLEKVLNLKNTGGKALPAISNFDFEGFTGFLPDPDGCLGEVLNPGDTCPVLVSYFAFETGPHSATVTLNAGAGQSASATVSGTGIDVIEPAEITMDPETRDFGSVVSGMSSTAVSFNVFHGGEADSGPLNLTISGPDASQFVISDPFCQGYVLTERTVCVVKVEFRPTSTGPKSATLQVSATPGGSRTATLTGTGLPAATLSVNPTSKDFGSVTLGQASETTVFTVTNNGAGTAGTSTWLDPQIVGTDASSFKFDIPSSNCGQFLAPGASCNIGIWFQPEAGPSGTKSASLSVSAAPGGTASSSLTGAAVAPLTPAQFSITPSSYDFGSVAVGNTAVSNTVFTVTNTGQLTSSNVMTQIVGGGGAYTVVNNNCTDVPKTLAPGATCTFRVEFAPFIELLTFPAQVNVFGEGIPGTSLSLSGTRP
jgi:hypothetical protein